jgi:hypothetical protein
MKEEYKDQAIDHMNDLPSDRQIRDSAHASTDLRTSFDPHLTLQRRTNNFVHDEHISISNRLRENLQNTINGETLAQSINPPSQANILDSAQFRSSGPNPMVSINSQEETKEFEGELNRNNQFFHMSKNLINKEVIMNSNQRMRCKRTNEASTQRVKNLKGINEEEMEDIQEFLNESINSLRRLSEQNPSNSDSEEEKKDHSRYNPKSHLSSKAVIHNTSVQNPLPNNEQNNKHISFSIHPNDYNVGSAKREEEMSKDYYNSEKDIASEDRSQKQNLMTIRLKNNFFDHSADSDSLSKNDRVKEIRQFKNASVLDRRPENLNPKKAKDKIVLEREVDSRLGQL